MQKSYFSRVKITCLKIFRAECFYLWYQKYYFNKLETDLSLVLTAAVGGRFQMETSC